MGWLTTFNGLAHHLPTGWLFTFSGLAHHLQWAGSSPSMGSTLNGIAALQLCSCHHCCRSSTLNGIVALQLRARHHCCRSSTLNGKACVLGIDHRCRRSSALDSIVIFAPTCLASSPTPLHARRHRHPLLLLARVTAPLPSLLHAPVRGAAAFSATCSASLPPRLQLLGSGSRLTGALHLSLAEQMPHLPMPHWRRAWRQ